MTLIASADWLSIGQASRFLGVHIGTVREWTDAGILPSFRTPGGHRRFSRFELENFLDQQRNPSKQNANPTEQTLARLREELQANLHAAWLEHAKVSPDQQEHARQREFGRRLLGCVVAFAQEPNARERLLDEGRFIAHEYGRALAASGIAAGSAARATIHFRQLILKTVLSVRLGSGSGEDDASLLQRVSAFLDEILLAIVEEYP